jgi:hypothetical protein
VDRIGKDKFLLDYVFDHIDENFFHVLDNLDHNERIGVLMVVDFEHNDDLMNEKDSDHRNNSIEDVVHGND